jgi:hypothetical protein
MQATMHYRFDLAFNQGSCQNFRAYEIFYSRDIALGRMLGSFRQKTA